MRVRWSDATFAGTHNGGQSFRENEKRYVPLTLRERRSKRTARRAWASA